jgi:hypothetical protein
MTHCRCPSLPQSRPPGLPKDRVTELVACRGVRPQFPAATPPAYAALAAACWASDPAARPPARDVAAALGRLVPEFTATGGAGGAPPLAGPWPRRLR